MNRLRVLLVAVLSALPVVPGCDSGVSRDELGTVLFEVPEVAGADELYIMPELGPPLPEEDDPFGMP